MRKARKYPRTPDNRLTEVLEMISSGSISLSDPSTLRISKHEVVVRANNKTSYGILSIPESLRQKPYITVLLEYFTTEHILKNSISSQSKDFAIAKNFISFVETQTDSNISPADYPQAYYRYLIETDTAQAVLTKLRTLKAIYKHSIDSEYGKASNIPKEVRGLQVSLASIKLPRPPSKKRPPLGKYLSIPPSEFTNRELFFGLRLGAIWLLNNIHSIRTSLTQIPSIKAIISSLAGLTEDEIKKRFVGDTKKLKKRIELQKPCFDQWQVTIQNPLLAEWQFYSVIKLSKYCLCYSRNHSKEPFSSENHQELLSRYIDKNSGVLRKSTKGYGRSDKSWAPFKPIFKSAREISRTQCVIWGLDWIRHTAIEKLLFTWLLSSERIQPAGINSLKSTSISVDLDNPKTLQITSLKMRRARGPTIKNAEVKSPIYRKSNPPFGTYLNWLKTNIEATALIADYNPGSYLIVQSSAALIGSLRTSREMETYRLFRLLITPNTTWNTTFLNENAENPKEARAFLEILKSRIIPIENENILLKLPPDPISQSAVLIKELETNLTEQHSDLNSETFGHSSNTGRFIYKDGFLSSGVEEIRSVVDDFIRHLGNEKYKEALLLSERLRTSTKKTSLLELKEFCNIPDSSNSINKLLQLLSSQDKLLLSGLIESGAQKYVIETDLTAAIMSSYLDHLESHIPNLSVSERSFKAISIMAEYIHLTQILEGFSEHIKKSGELLKKELNLHFPPRF